MSFAKLLQTIKDFTGTEVVVNGKATTFDALEYSDDRFLLVVSHELTESPDDIIHSIVTSRAVDLYKLDGVYITGDGNTLVLIANSLLKTASDKRSYMYNQWGIEPGNKIQSIKSIRQITGIGLKEAKIVYEALVS